MRTTTTTTKAEIFFLVFDATSQNNKLHFFFTSTWRHVTNVKFINESITKLQGLNIDNFKRKIGILISINALSRYFVLTK